jgi:hypothetical protein
LDHAICCLTFGAVSTVNGRHDRFSSVKLAIKFGLRQQDHFPAGSG